MRNKTKVESKKLQIKILSVTTLLFFIFSLSSVIAQDSVNATGGNASGSGGSASYSVGQLVYNTYTGTNGSVLQGAQQPYEISVVTGLEEAIGINLTAYPNPVTDQLILSVDNFELSKLYFQLFDMRGQLLQKEKITANQTTIAMSNLGQATYFVKVIQGNKEVKTFKIIKK